MVGMICVSSCCISQGELKAGGLLINDKLSSRISQMDAAVHVSATIMLFETNVLLEDVVSYVDTCSTHIAVIFKFRERLDRVGDVDGIASKVSHVLREGVAFQIDIRLRICPVGASVTFEIGRVDMNGTSTCSNIFNELVTSYDDRALICNNHECTDRLILLNEIGVVERLCGISNGLEHIRTSVVGWTTRLEFKLT